MAKFDMTQLEEATSIPAGSLHLVEMGDGSGTKTVTQETMVKETGKALKIGNPEELQTENKENLVAAINEAAQSGGGGASVDILDSKEEIEANTEAGKVAGAAAVKAMFGELNDNLIGLSATIPKIECGFVTPTVTSSSGNYYQNITLNGSYEKMNGFSYVPADANYGFITYPTFEKPSTVKFQWRPGQSPSTVYSSALKGYFIFIGK